MNTKATTTNIDSLYRPGVGLAIFNQQGFVFVAERLDSPNSWQMPQGGIDEGEDFSVAAFREMEEEIGTRNARIIGMMEEWIYYDIPERTAKKLWDGKYKGQRQKWIALEFLGKDEEINLDFHEHPEFSRWKWISIDELKDHAVHFKKKVYKEVMKNFREYALVLAKQR